MEASRWMLDVRPVTLARAEPDLLSAWLREGGAARMIPLSVLIALGCGLYGFAIGLGRSPLMAVYVAMKMPLLVFLTLGANGLLNGMFGSLLGSGMSFRQTMQASLISFAIFALIVGSLSPLVIGMVLDAPPPDDPGRNAWYRMFLLLNTAVIAFAGVVANHRLLRLIVAFSGSRPAAIRTLVAWLAGNLFVGAQLSYNLRPFFGNPQLPVEFLRADPFDGTFYEAVWHLSVGAVDGEDLFALRLIALLILVTALCIWVFARMFIAIIEAIRQ